MTFPENFYALNTHDEIVHIDAVSNGAECNCHCLCCGEMLIAKNGGAIVAHHFAHQSQSSCSGGTGESLYHWAFKRSIVMTGSLPISRSYSIVELEALRINLDSTNSQMLQLESPTAEVKILCGENSYTCDVVAFSGTKRIGVEITYKHKTSITKMNDLSLYGLSVIELTLQQAMLPDLSMIIKMVNNSQWIQLRDVFNMACSVSMPSSWTEQITLYKKSMLVDELKKKVEIIDKVKKQLIEENYKLKEKVKRLQHNESAYISKIDELEIRLSCLLSAESPYLVNNALCSRLIELEERLQEQTDM